LIKFEKIRWKNFLSTGNRFTEVTLNESRTTLISGSNGHGKCLDPTTNIEINIKDPKTEKKFRDFLKK